MFVKLNYISENWQIILYSIKIGCSKYYLHLDFKDRNLYFDF